jgi:hypothetical protein
VPIKSIFTLKLSVPEHHQDVDCYMLDLDALSETQINGVVAVISLRFGIAEDEIRGQLHEQGVPIIADGVSVRTLDQGIILSMIEDPELTPFWDHNEELSGLQEWEDD